MNIYAIGDLHLPGRQNKPMDIFGPEWKNHGERIARGWKEIVSEKDVVLVPGDLSWALKLEDAADDLGYLGRLPGKVIISRGNHDYWWQSIGKVRRVLPPHVSALQNDYVEVSDGLAICGTRGWDIPGVESFSAQDRKLYERELNRLKLSLKSATKNGLVPLIVMLHFPPMTKYMMQTGFTELLETFNVRLCVYGHLHGDAGRRNAFTGKHRGVEYRLVAADAIDFKPVKVARIIDGTLQLYLGKNVWG